MCNLWKGIYGSIEVDYLIYVLKYDQSLFKLESGLKSNNFTNTENLGNLQQKADQVKKFYQSLQDLRTLVHESEFALVNIIVVVNEVVADDAEASENSVAANRMKEVRLNLFFDSKDTFLERQNLFKERIKFYDFVPESRQYEGARGYIELIPMDVSNKDEYFMIYRHLRKLSETKLK